MDHPKEDKFRIQYLQRELEITQKKLATTKYELCKMRSKVNTVKKLANEEQQAFEIGENFKTFELIEELFGKVDAN